jgi:hypothetical protein
MSTRASLIYDSINELHIYQELINNTVHIEIEKDGILVDVNIMPFEKWVSLGLPPNNIKNIETKLARLRTVEANVLALRDKWVLELKESDLSDLDDDLKSVYRLTMSAAIEELDATLEQKS